jgi:hypothetical protein
VRRRHEPRLPVSATLMRSISGRFDGRLTMANGGNALSAAMWNGRANEESAHLSYSLRARPGCAVWNTITSAPYVLKTVSPSLPAVLCPWRLGRHCGRRSDKTAPNASGVAPANPATPRLCAALLEWRRLGATERAHRHLVSVPAAISLSDLDVYKGVSTERGNCGNSSIFRRKRSVRSRAA